MKTIIITLFLLMGCISGSFSQSLKLNIVSKEKEPLAYAYIFINSRLFSSTDSCGKIEIPCSLLTIGDTITASYTGAKDNFYIYNNETSIQKEYSIELVQDILLNEVVVKSVKNSNKLFRKYVKTPYIGNWYDEFNGDMRININYSKQQNKNIKGSFKYTLLPSNYKKINKIDEFNISTNSDTIGFNFLVKKSVEMLAIAQYEAVLWKSGYANKGLIALYMGEANNNHVFMITRPAYYEMNKNLESSQLLLYVDKKSKNVVSAEILSVYGNGVLRYDLNVSFITNDKLNLIYPSKIEGTLTFQTKQGKFVCEVLLDNIYHFRKGKNKNK